MSRLAAPMASRPLWHGLGSDGNALAPLFTSCVPLYFKGMRIVCPDCSAIYDLPPERVPPGRAVRCVRCKQSWTPIPRQAPPAPERPPGPPPEPSRARVAGLTLATPDAAAATPVAPASMLDRIKLPGAWLLTALVLAGLVWAGISRRAEIMRAWPPSERAYIALGLSPRS